MNKEESAMLARIDQKVINIDKVLFDKPKYTTIKEKVLLHDKVFWLILAVSITAVVKSFWG